MKSQHIILILLFAGCVLSAFAKERTITGKVTTSEGMVLPGIHIVIKGTNNGVHSDFNGQYTINADVGNILVFSGTGKKTIERTVGKSDVIDVQLQEDIDVLAELEVVVVAFGKQEKRAIVGTVATVSDKVLKHQQLSNVLTGIQGSVPGVNVMSVGGQPGNNPTIRVRGVNSINAEAGPLIIVDGAPFNGNLNTLSADQIANINILKDASATALYGSRGSNGVLLINTKKGQFDTPVKIAFTSSTGLAGQAVKFHKLLDTDTYVQYTWEALRNSFWDELWNLYPDDDAQDLLTKAEQIASNELVAFLGYNPYGIPNPVDTNGNLVSSNKLWDTNWEELLFNRAALRTEHSISISGGSDKISYFLSANYLSQEGSIKTSFFDRITTRINIDTRVNSWLSAGINAFYSTSEQDNPTQSGNFFDNPTLWLISVPSLYPLYQRDETGQLIPDSSGNPVYDYGNNAGQSVNGIRTLSDENAVGALYNYETIYNRTNFTANTYARIRFNENIVFKAQLAYENYLLDSFDYAGTEVGYAADDNGSLTKTKNVITTTNLITMLDYNKSIADHNIGASFIHEAYTSKWESLYISGAGFFPGIKVFDGSASPSGLNGNLYEERLSGYLGRITYNFKNRYYLEGSYRRDGATQFARDVRWGGFFSVGGAWIVSGEPLLATNGIFNFLKVRASYGQLGNNRGIGYFPYVQAFNAGYNQLDNIGLIFGNAADSGIRWEKTASVNFGIEFGLFNNRITGELNYYDKNSIDLIYNKPLASSTGNSFITTNIGGVRNYGIEFHMNLVNLQKENFEWTTGLNFSMNRNKITGLTQESVIDGLNRWEEGKSLYEFWIREAAGVDPATGRALWYVDVLDAEGQPTGVRDTTSIYSAATLYYTGKTSLPDIIGGFTHYIRLYGFDINMLFNFSFGAYVYDDTYANLMSGIALSEAASPDLVRRWQQPGDITDVPRLLADGSSSGTSTRFLFKNDYVRLKALNLGYNFPEETISEIGLSKLRLYLQADNLLTFQSHKGIDPEQGIDGITDYRSYNQRIVALGIHVEF